MPEFSSETRTKIAALRAIYRANGSVETYELLKVYWPEPTGTIWYATKQIDEIASSPPPVSPIQTRLIADDAVASFLPVQIDATIGDEEIDLKFWDGDEAISDLLLEHGEGVKTEPYYWFPQAGGLLLPFWQGHLRFEDEAEPHILPLKAAQGFRSSDAIVPGRACWPTCQAVFGGLQQTQAAIDEGGCPFNFHLGGSIGNNDPGTGEPWTFCDRRDHQSCIDRGVDPNFHLSHRTVSMVIVNNQSSGPRLYSHSQGNETNLKEPVRKVYGTRRVYDLQVMTFRKDLNNNTPEHGWFRAQYGGLEGPIDAWLYPLFRVGGVWQQMHPLHYAYRLGHKGQTPLGTGLTTHAFSLTAYLDYNFGYVDPRTIEPNEASATAIARGANDVRVYTDAETYTKIYTTNPVWIIMDILCNKIWGFGLDYERFNIPAWIAAAAWAATAVRHVDIDGNVWDHVRANCEVELVGRKIQQQIEDLCTSMRLSLPFMFDGQVHIVPLSALTEEELDDCPVFTDEGDTGRNVIWEGEGDEKRSTLRYSRKSDIDLDNRIECTYDDWQNDHLETPLAPIEDVPAQLAAGRVVGDNARKTNKKEYKLLGVVINPQAMKCGNGLLDLGPLDSGGLRNNLGIKFKIWYLDSLDLHPFKVIRYDNSKIAKYGFTHFRIMKMSRGADLTVDIEAQAYPIEYMNTFEVDQEEIEDPGSGSTGGGWGNGGGGSSGGGSNGTGVLGDTGLGEELEITNIRHIDGVLEMEIVQV